MPVEIADRPRPARDAAAVLRLRRLLAGTQPEVVHAHGLRAGAVAAFALAGAGWRRRHRCALVVTVHNAPPAAGPAGAVYAVLERIVARRADAVTCVSGDLAARMRRLGAAEAGLAVVPAPPAGAPGREAVAAARSDLGGGGQPVVLAVGRLAAQKGFGTLLAAAAGWQGRDPRPRARPRGRRAAGPACCGPRRTRAGSGCASSASAGTCPPCSPPPTWSWCPSRWEGQPLIVQEALRAGRPLVASRTGGIPDLTGEDAAVLVPPGDAAALAAAVLAVLDDPGLAARLSRAARARAAALPGEAAAVDAALALYQRTAGRPAAV